MAHFVEQWEELTENKWVLSIVRNGFKIPFKSVPPLINLSLSSSPLLGEEIAELLKKRAVEGVWNPGTPFFYSRLFLVPKEWKVTPSNRSFLTKSVYKQTAFQDGDGQVSKTIDNGQRLGCLHRSGGCISSCSDTSKIQKILRFDYEHQVFQFTVLLFEMSLSQWIFTKLMNVIAAHIQLRAVSLFLYLDD